MGADACLLKALGALHAHHGAAHGGNHHADNEIHDQSPIVGKEKLI